MLRVSERRIPLLIQHKLIPKPLILGAKTKRWRASDFEPQVMSKARNGLDALLEVRA